MRENVIQVQCIGCDLELLSCAFTGRQKAKGVKTKDLKYTGDPRYQDLRQSKLSRIMITFSLYYWTICFWYSGRKLCKLNNIVLKLGFHHSAFRSVSGIINQFVLDMPQATMYDLNFRKPRW